MNPSTDKNVKGLIPVVVFANREDFWFTKLCVASIRYYYPDVPVYLVKDNLNGRFSTDGFCKLYNVTTVDLGRPYYGWSAAKVHFLVNEKLPAGKYLTLDSDIVFTGALLERLATVPADFIVHGEKHTEPFPQKTKDTFFDPEKIRQLYSGYQYPGFFFNAGQMVVTLGRMEKDHFKHCFNFEKYPYYFNRDAFPVVDQSILNCLLPVLAAENKLTLSETDYMLWSGNFFDGGNKDNVETIRDPSNLPYLLHYAGDLRTYKIEKMRGRNILAFFKTEYYRRLSAAGRIFSAWQDWWYSQRWFNRILFKKNRLMMKLFSIG